MMTMPNFINSPYFVDDFENWHLKDGAPKEVVDEFNEWIKEFKEMEERMTKQPDEI